MEQAQVFASAWSLVGGRFDNGDGLAHAEAMKSELRMMLLAALVEAQQPAPSAAAEVKLEQVHGDVLPPVGSRVFIRHGRDDDAHVCIVTGYYAWGDLHGDKRLHRVFVRMVYEGTTTEQARMLCDCYPTAEAALAPQPSPTPQADSQPAPVMDYPPLPQGWPALFRCDSCDGNGEVGEPMCMGRFQPPERARCPDCDGRGWSSEEDAFSADHMRAYVNADRAARAPADSVTAPAGATNTKTHELLSTTVGLLMGYREGGTRRPYKPGSVIAKVVDEVVDHLKGWPYPEPTPPARAADSVLEDAAQESEYRRGYRHGYEQRDAEVRGALT